MNEGTCKSCNAPIYWAKTESGKAIPLDRPGESRVVIEAGRAKVRQTFVAHFATCPNADKHRKGKDHGNQTATT